MSFECFTAGGGGDTIVIPGWDGRTEYNYFFKLTIASWNFIILRRSGRMRRRSFRHKAPIVDREYRHMRGKEVRNGLHYVFLQKDLESSLIPSEIARNIITRDSRTFWYSTDRDINMSIQESSQRPLQCGHYYIYFILQKK